LNKDFGVGEKASKASGGEIVSLRVKLTWKGPGGGHNWGGKTTGFRDDSARVVARTRGNYIVFNPGVSDGGEMQSTQETGRMVPGLLKRRTEH